MIEIIQRFMGSGLMVIWFLVALIYLLYAEKRRPRRILMIYLPVLVLLLFFNPLFYRVFYALVGQEIYFRMLWLLPVTLVIAYSAVCFSNSLKGRRRAGFVVTVLVLTVISGKLVYTSPLYSPAENPYHVPDEVVEICDAIEVEGREVMAVFPEDLLLYVRQYSPVICMPYGREVIMGSYHELAAQFYQEEIMVEKLAELSKSEGCHYVIINKEEKLVGDMADYGYEEFLRTGDYIVYKDTTMDFGV